MENASKALIIAGAILISLLIISLGILIYNQATGAAGDDGMTKAEIATFNNDYIKYEGVQKGSVVKDLIQKVNINIHCCYNVYWPWDIFTYCTVNRFFFW